MCIEHDHIPSLRRFGTLLLRTPSHLIATAGSALLVLVLVYPPFVVPLSEGLINNLGFAFILNPPRAGNLAAIVNTPLLIVLAVGVVAITAACVFVAHSIEATISSSQKQ